MHSHAHDGHGVQDNGRGGRATAVLHVGDLHYASEKAVVERVLTNRPGRVWRRTRSHRRRRHGAVATVAGRRVLVGNRRLLEREHVSLDGLAVRADEMAGAGRTVVHVAVDSRPAGLIAIADGLARRRRRRSPR